ncbi:hypothetical protein [Photobacterium salinisoli]|uniref:hypothetical protein n=1 Tax=Photobacterium salinisoli TaxID=1616783 RepID=UPI000EA2C398|nr:hypothetical protein [Photobacterium salinisoli]
MEAVAIWLLFFGSLPVLYWSFRLIFDSVAAFFLSEHIVELEVEQEDGSWKSTVVDVSNDEDFYNVAMKALRSQRSGNEPR